MFQGVGCHHCMKVISLLKVFLHLLNSVVPFIKFVKKNDIRVRSVLTGSHSLHSVDVFPFHRQFTVETFARRELSGTIVMWWQI
jgi:hypothetical protein